MRKKLTKYIRRRMKMVSIIESFSNLEKIRKIDENINVLKMFKHVKDENLRIFSLTLLKQINLYIFLNILK